MRDNTQHLIAKVPGSVLANWGDERSPEEDVHPVSSNSKIWTIASLEVNRHIMRRLSSYPCSRSYAQCVCESEISADLWLRMDFTDYVLPDMMCVKTTVKWLTPCAEQFPQSVDRTDDTLTQCWFKHICTYPPRAFAFYFKVVFQLFSHSFTCD